MSCTTALLHGRVSVLQNVQLRRQRPAFEDLPARNQPRQARYAGVRVQALSEGGVGKFLKKVQGSLPVIGLMSRILSPEGGFDGQLSYSEYCRLKFEKGSSEFGIAISELPRLRKKNARLLLFCCWVIATGREVLPPEQILGACNRTAIPGLDLEYECYRFEEAADAGRKRRLRLKNPAPPPSAAETEEMVRKAVLAWLAVPDAAALSEEEQGYVDAIVKGFDVTS